MRGYLDKMFNTDFLNKINAKFQPMQDVAQKFSQNIIIPPATLKMQELTKSLLFPIENLKLCEQLFPGLKKAREISNIFSTQIALQSNISSAINTDRPKTIDRIKNINADNYYQEEAIKISVNTEYWLKNPLWTPSETAYLLCNKKPSKPSFTDNSSITNDDVSYMHYLICNSIRAGEFSNGIMIFYRCDSNDFKLNPFEVYQWAKDKGFDLPDWFNDYGEKIMSESVKSTRKQNNDQNVIYTQSQFQDTRTIQMPAETFTIKQLLTRWYYASLNNIYEIANKGYFGLYFKPKLERKDILHTHPYRPSS